jgi:hypothetical protein
MRDVQVEVTRITCPVLTLQRGVDLVPCKVNIQNFVVIDIQGIKLGVGLMHVK